MTLGTGVDDPVLLGVSIKRCGVVVLLNINF